MPHDAAGLACGGTRKISGSAAGVPLAGTLLLLSGNACLAKSISPA